MDPHRLAEIRSIAYHRAVAEKLHKQPELIEVALERLANWEKTGHCALKYIEQWRHKLSYSLDKLEVFLVADTESARELRQSTPFAGIIDARERWRIWRETLASVNVRQ
ncbi:MAG: hypothetical protein JW841_14585 [Deltaproteobacteria bacterium]|nr:hypothetical protein [Deltaproteobacteria bacterium]